MAGRQEAGWRFSTLYLVKDGLGVMLAAAGLAEDALREFFELEAAYLEALASGGSLADSDFGALPRLPRKTRLASKHPPRPLGRQTGHGESAPCGRCAMSAGEPFLQRFVRRCCPPHNPHRPPSMPDGQTKRASCAGSSDADRELPLRCCPGFIASCAHWQLRSVGTTGRH